ncbi:MAG: protein kinase [Gemmatimonadetes bacterium]|nr:protein kinase [Gemmatimonadota bacterium]
MNSERWEWLNELFHAARALAPEERPTFLAERCGDDPGLREEVERLIAAHERAGQFIEVPALASGGSWVQARIHPAPGHRFGPYRVAGEIARGGMGAVYLAERADGQYERRVALKVIKGGMDTHLVLERFRAERQILAQLDHPNIARLLDGGTTEAGQPYFVMEYIEGEAIDRYVQVRGLSVPERLRLFLQVCDAVSYAHGHRVVHRDIKPANILVTGEGVPKLLDFGIAKVLESEVDDAASSTTTGLRLLTPRYASPEQVQGRRATTASDIYSLGVVLYELLTGCSPYQARSLDPLDVAEAVRTSDPERPSAAVARSTGSREREPRRADPGRSSTPSDASRHVSRQLRGDLDTIVLTALRKEPSRRYRSVGQMAEDIQRHLDGLPVRARPDTLHYRAGKFLRRNRSIVAAGVAGLATALLLVAGSVALRGTRDAPSLMATGLLAPRDRVVLADFTDRTGDPSLAASVTEAFRVDLTQSPLVRVLTPMQVRSALERMELAPDLPVGDSLAREVALREGAKAFVTGTVARVGSAYTISVQLVSAERGEALTAHRETAADSSQLIAAVDRASKELRHRFGESLRELGDTPPLDQVTTPSLPALRKYTEAYRFYRQGERTRALRLYEESVALDTGFAMAYRAMAVTYEALAEPGRATLAHRHALANRHRLPFRERQFLEADRARARGDYQAVIEAYTRVLERLPSDVSAMNNISLAYRDWRRFAKAESWMHRAIRTDSTIPVLYYGLHSQQVLQGSFAESRRTLELIARRFPGDPLLPVVQAQDAAARRAWDEAEERARANIAARAGDTLQLVDAYEQLAGIVMTRGRLDEAERHWRTQLRMSAASGSWRCRRCRTTARASRWRPSRAS